MLANITAPRLGRSNRDNQVESDAVNCTFFKLISCQLTKIHSDPAHCAPFVMGQGRTWPVLVADKHHFIDLPIRKR